VSTNTYHRSRRATLYDDIPGLEDAELEFSVGPRSFDPHEYGRREVELIEVRDDDGPRPDLIDSIPDAQLDMLYGHAIDQVEGREVDAFEEEQERRADADREARLMGDRIY